MSFGKDDSNLGRLGTYGATSQQMGNASRRKSAPRKGSLPWANNYRPSEGTSDTIRLIPGDYEADRIDPNTGAVFTEKVPWFEYTEHFHGGLKKGITCSGGVFRMADRKKAEPCRGCEIWREDYETRKQIEAEKGIKPEQPKRVSFSDKFAFIVLDMGWFFKGYRFDEHGRPKVGQNGQPYTDWIKYTNDPQSQGAYAATQADLARQNKAVETQQGLVQSWPVNSTQFNTLIGFSDMAQRHCKNCGGMNCIHVQSYHCPHCQAPTFADGATTMPADKIKEVVNDIVTCRHCKQQGYPRPVMSCQHCSNPTPATLYDVDLQMQVIKVNKTYQLHLAGMSNPKPIDGVYGELLKKLPDLPKKFAPTPYDEQIAVFGPPSSSSGMGAPQGGYQPQFGQQPQYGTPQGQYGAPQGFQTPAFGNYGAPAPQYSGAQTPSQPVQTQTWNPGQHTWHPGQWPGNGNQ